MHLPKAGRLLLHGPGSCSGRCARLGEELAEEHFREYLPLGAPLCLEMEPGRERRVGSRELLEILARGFQQLEAAAVEP